MASEMRTSIEAQPDARRALPSGLDGDAPELSLVVKTISHEAERVMGIRLAALGASDLPAWTPGAHIDILLPNGLERQYSLCGDPDDRRHWQIAVLREVAGRGGSEWLHSRIREGDVLRARGTRNNFSLADAGAYLFVAGGIGITPLLPMIREVGRRGVPWRLLYGGRSRRSMAFATELAADGGQVCIRPEDEYGLLDLEGFLGEPRHGVAIYCCGPERLLRAMEAVCERWPDGILHVERFRPSPGAPDGVNGAFEVVLAKSGITCRVGADESILDALEKAGIYVPRSCGEGTCGTCLTPVAAGIPDHRDSFLMGKKRAANDAICVCCSRSRTPRLVLNL
jgi:ferredoxin-NADP reductase